MICFCFAWRVEKDPPCRTAGLLVVVSSASISTACRQQCAMIAFFPVVPIMSFESLHFACGCFSPYRFHYFQVYLGLSATCPRVSTRDLGFSVAGFVLRTTSSFTSEASVLSLMLPRPLFSSPSSLRYSVIGYYWCFESRLAFTVESGFWRSTSLLASSTCGQ
ncbi:hypothetical protein AXX17_AT5G28700 [Arabidopsis thaliana]|uniref:Uncharacterized protein n=1 Tax=Arabidopsis thaliana TaxID=3702 RepID=A0A178UPJ0_ARATH|nr:hypothetical protein AXX17_AT5G28700 [Arabidopsis thaliana]